MQPEYAQFILMRTDLLSLNPGKAMAQAAHAANALDNKIENNVQWIHPTLLNGYKKWKNETEQGFGTCLVYDGWGLENSFRSDETEGYVYEEVFDPSYPIRDGKVIHHIPLTTCGIVFGEYEHVKGLMVRQGFRLHK